MSHEKIFVTFFKLASCVGKIVTHFFKLGNFNFHVTISGVVGRKGGWVGELARPPRDVTKTGLLGNHKSRGCWESRLAPQCHFPNNPTPLLIYDKRKKRFFLTWQYFVVRFPIYILKERKSSFLRDNILSFGLSYMIKERKSSFFTWQYFAFRSPIYYERKKRFFLTWQYFVVFGARIYYKRKKKFFLTWQYFAFWFLKYYKRKKRFFLTWQYLHSSERKFLEIKNLYSNSWKKTKISRIDHFLQDLIIFSADTVRAKNDRRES